jgi:hypothetical protein
MHYHSREYEAYRARVPMLFPTGVKRGALDLGDQRTSASREVRTRAQYR